VAENKALHLIEDQSNMDPVWVSRGGGRTLAHPVAPRGHPCAAKLVQSFAELSDGTGNIKKHDLNHSQSRELKKQRDKTLILPQIIH
jgi:hypothetical protein